MVSARYFGKRVLVSFQQQFGKYVHRQKHQEHALWSEERGETSQMLSDLFAKLCDK